MTQKKIHLCMLMDAWYPFVGGGQVHVKKLSHYLSIGYPIKIRLFHSPHHHLLIRLVWSIWVIPQVIFSHLKQPFDLVHSHAFLPGLPGKILSLLLGIPVIYTVHGSHLMDQNTNSPKAFFEKILLTKISYSHQISVTQSFTKYPNVNKNISVIRNGVDIKEFNQQKVKKNTKFTLLYVGRDHPTKGLDLLRAAYHQVKLQCPKINLKLITSGKITGKALAREYKRAHAFVLPSLVEGQPIVLLEAWAAKLPVIATKTSGVAEIAQDNQDAILVKTASTNALKTAILKLYRMPRKHRQALALAGYRQIKLHYTWDKIAAQTQKLYLKVLS